MQARRLKKILSEKLGEELKYYVADYGDYIAVGSPFCHSLISVDKKSFKLKYALDAFGEGRKAIQDSFLVMIWDNLNILIADGELQKIIDGIDDIPPEKRIPVFTFKNHRIVESYTDDPGWPNTTYEGELMHDNTHFRSREKAIEKYIRKARLGIKAMAERVSIKKDELADAHRMLAKEEADLEYLLAEIEKEGNRA